MSNLLFPSDYSVTTESWFALLDDQRRAAIVADATTFSTTGRCVHGRSAARLLLEWRLEAEAGATVLPNDPMNFDVRGETWFGYLDAEAQAECVAEFDRIASADESDNDAFSSAYWGWKSTAFVCADPELRDILSRPLH
jgi:hypothetical protein